MKHKAQNTTEVIAVVSMVIVVAVAALMFMNKKQTHLADLSGVKNTGISSSSGMYERDEYNRGASETAGGVGQTAMNKAPALSRPTRAPQTTSKPQSSQDGVELDILISANNKLAFVYDESLLIDGTKTKDEIFEHCIGSVDMITDMINSGNVTMEQLQDGSAAFETIVDIVGYDKVKEETVDAWGPT